MRRECPEWDVPPEWVEVQRIDEQLQNDPEIQRILNTVPPANADGAFPPTGAIGQVVVMEVTLVIPQFSLSPPYDTLAVLQPSLPAGDWLLWPSAWWQRSYPSVSFSLPPPTGFSGNLAGGFYGGASNTSTLAVGIPCHARTTGGTGLVFNVNVTPGAGVFSQGNFTLRVEGQRLR